MQNFKSGKSWIGIVTSCKSATPSPHAGPSVQAYSVHVCNAGNVNDRLNRGLGDLRDDLRGDLRGGAGKP